MTASSYLLHTARLGAVTALALGISTLVGCGVGTSLQSNSVSTPIALLSGKINGGPNPVGQARVVLYTTGDSSGASTGYGVGNAVQTATSDNDGNFHFNAGYTCPAAQYAYIAVYGGKTGSNTANPNSILVAALGPCGTVGGFVIVNELTTIAAGYALSNFINVTGNAVSNYVVGIGAPASNNATSACVANSYYTGCTGTAAAGLRHAFANARALVNTTTGQPVANTASGALVPVQFINTLGNVLQSCVNSSGGGTNVSGAPSTTTSASGTTHDGTPCGRLFAYTSYTLNGTATGTLVASGNTLSAVVNLAKRPTGSATLFDSACSSNTTGSTTAATCIFNLGTPVGVYQLSMTSAPSDWLLGIVYPKTSFSTSLNTATCTGSPASNGLLYPFMVATDINDNVVILNGDASTSTCYNVLSVASDGSSIAANAFDANNAIPIWISTDAFGHALVPTHGTVENGVRIYGATDTNIPLLTTLPAVANTGTNGPFYTAVDQNDGIYVTSQTNPSGGNAISYVAVSGAESHAVPTYAAPTSPTPTSTSKLDMINVDVNGVGFTTTNSSTGPVTRALAGASTTQTTSTTMASATTNGVTTGADNLGNVWNVINAAGTFSTGNATTVATPSSNVLVFKQTYTTAGGVVTLSAPTQVATLTPGAVKAQNGQIDGNNVVWFTDLQGATTSSPSVVINSSNLHGYDTVNAFDTHAYVGCKFTSTSSTACGTQTTDATYPSGTPYLFYGSRGLAIDAAGSIWVANGTQGTLNEIIGTAAPTWPLFIHNGVSNKP